MEASADNSARSLFRPFDRDSLNTIQTRIDDKRKRPTTASTGIGSIADYDDPILPDPRLEAGELLVETSSSSSLPNELVGKLIEDIDPYYDDKPTLVVVDRCRRIWRFGATKALWCLEPWNPIRRAAIRAISHPAFNAVILLVIVLNCLFMTAADVHTSLRAAYPVFFSVYLAECVVKIVARGFVLDKFTYLRDPVNVMDFTLLLLGFITIAVNLGDFSVLRLLKVIAYIPQLRKLAYNIYVAILNTRDVVIVLLTTVGVFSLLGLQLYMGVLTKKCIRHLPSADEDEEHLGLSGDQVHDYFANESNWWSLGGDPPVCGNASGSRMCPENYICLEGFGPNPDYGYTNFDSYGWSMLNILRQMTGDYWESILRMVLDSAGPWNFIFFIIVILAGNYWLFNMVMLVVAMSFDELQMKDELELEEQQALATGGADGWCGTNDESSPQKDQSRKYKPDDIPLVDQPQNDDASKGAPVAKGACSKCTDTLCVWDCCACWTKFRKGLCFIVDDALFEVFIQACILGHVILLCLDHHAMSAELESHLRCGHHVLVVVYTLEVVLKMLAYSPKPYFEKGWNRFDFIVTSLNLVELGLEDVSGLSLLRFLFLMRIFKLSRVWPGFRRVLTLALRLYCKVLFRLLVILFVIMFVLAMLGVELIGSYEDNSHYFYDSRVPRWHFGDFMHAFMQVFRAMCGEWIEGLWDCALVSGWFCIPYFIFCGIVLRYFVVFGVFFAVYFSGAGRESKAMAKEDPPNAIRIVVDRVKRLFGRPVEVRTNQLFPKEENTNDVEIMIQKDEDHNNENQEQNGNQPKLENGEVSKETKDTHPTKCCPLLCYECVPWCAGQHTPLWQNWGKLRRLAFRMIKSKFFGALVIVVVSTSIVALMLEDLYLKQNPVLESALKIIDWIFTLFVLVEMIAKWVGLGFRRYFSQPWCWVQFVITLVTLISFGRCVLTEAGPIGAFRFARSLRALRLVTALSHLKGTRVVPCTFLKSIPAVCKLLFACNGIWLVFVITGVQLFGGRFYRCEWEQNGQLHMKDYVVNSSWECDVNNHTWINSYMNFDNIFNSYTALFQVATMKGWIGIIHNAVDAKHVEDQPVTETNIFMFVYFVLFIVFCSFFTWFLVVGEIVNIYYSETRKDEDSLEAITGFQARHFQRALHKIKSKKPKKAPPTPRFRCQAKLLSLVSSRIFVFGMILVIVANMIVMSADHYQMPESGHDVLNMFNLVFVCIFLLECVLKIGAHGLVGYFRSGWNILDFIIVLFQVLGVLLRDLMLKYFVSPSLFSVLRLLRILRVLPSIKSARGVRLVLRTFTAALPELLTVLTLLFLVVFIYALFGMSFFKDVKREQPLDEVFNFGTFGQSMIVMLSVINAAGWDGILESLSNDHNCTPSEGGEDTSNCGKPGLALPFLLSYLFFVHLVITSMLIAVFIENYSSVVEEVQEGLTDDDCDSFYATWSKYDPDATKFVPYQRLPDLLDELAEPLQVPKPNKYRIIYFNIPICKDDCVYHSDVLDALVKDYFQRRGYEINSFAAVDPSDKVRPDGGLVVTSSLQRQRQEYSARVIQTAWRRYRVKDDGFTQVAAVAADCGSAKQQWNL